MADGTFTCCFFYGIKVYGFGVDYPELDMKGLPKDVSIGKKLSEILQNGEYDKLSVVVGGCDENKEYYIIIRETLSFSENLDGTPVSVHLFKNGVRDQLQDFMEDCMIPKSKAMYWVVPYHSKNVY